MRFYFESTWTITVATGGSNRPAHRIPLRMSQETIMRIAQSGKPVLSGQRAVSHLTPPGSGLELHVSHGGRSLYTTPAYQR